MKKFKTNFSKSLVLTLVLVILLGIASSFTISAVSSNNVRGGIIHQHFFSQDADLMGSSNMRPQEHSSVWSSVWVRNGSLGRETRLQVFIDLRGPTGIATFSSNLVDNVLLIGPNNFAGVWNEVEVGVPRMRAGAILPAGTNPALRNEFHPIRIDSTHTGRVRTQGMELSASWRWITTP